MDFWKKLFVGKRGREKEIPKERPSENETQKSPEVDSGHSLSDLLQMLEKYFVNLDKISLHIENIGKLEAEWQKTSGERAQIRKQLENGPTKILYKGKECTAELLPGGSVFISGTEEETGEEVMYRIDSDDVHNNKIAEENARAEIFEKENSHFVDSVCGGREKANKVIDLLKKIKKTLSDLSMEKKLRDQISLLQFRPQDNSLLESLKKKSDLEKEDDSKILAEIDFLNAELNKFLTEEKPSLTTRLSSLVEELKGLVNLKE